MAFFVTLANQRTEMHIHIYIYMYDIMNISNINMNHIIYD